MKKSVLLAVLLGYLGATCADVGKHASKGTHRASAEEHAFGREGDAKKVTRTVRIGMADTMRFSPAEFTIKRGETIKFIVHNNGRVKHEMVLGTVKELKEHAQMMKEHPGMEHNDPYMTQVAPGKTGTIVWQFTREGLFYYGCLEPGHFEAGMVGKVEVVK